MRSSRVGSAQWISSKTSTSGPRSERISTSRWTAQNVSASGNAVIAQAGGGREPLGDVLVTDEAAELGPGPVGRVVLVDPGRRIGRSPPVARR